MCFRMVFSRENPKVSDVRRRAPSRTKIIDVSGPMLLLEVSEFCTSECLLRETILRKRVGVIGENIIMQVKNSGIFYCPDFVDLKDEII